MSRPQSAPTRRTIRRQQLREIVPLADAAIYDMEQHGHDRGQAANQPPDAGMLHGSL